MKLSVLMTTYNGEKPDNLSEALYSITVEQTRKPDQVVLVVDGPVREELNNVIKKYEESEYHVMVVRLPQNVGQGGASKTGLEYCSHEIVARMDSDDISVSTRFETEMAVLEHNSDIDVVGGWIGEFDDDPSQITSIRIVPETDVEIKKYFRIRNAINNVSVMMRKKAIIRAGGYNINSVNEDYSLYVSMLIDGARFYNVQKIMVQVRVGNGMSNRRKQFKIFSDWIVDQNRLLKAKKTNLLIYCYSCLGCLVFVIAPTGLKKMLYKYLLRKKEK